MASKRTASIKPIERLNMHRDACSAEMLRHMLPTTVIEATRIGRNEAVASDLRGTGDQRAEIVAQLARPRTYNVTALVE